MDRDHEENIQQLHQEWKKKEEDLKRLFHERTSALTETIEKWKGDHAYMVDKYENRESREEDVQRIQELEEELNRILVESQAMRGQVQKLKRELMNREENYNKKFGRSVNVGVMDVLQTTPSSSSAPQPSQRKVAAQRQRNLPKSNPSSAQRKHEKHEQQEKSKLTQQRSHQQSSSSISLGVFPPK